MDINEESEYITSLLNSNQARKIVNYFSDKSVDYTDLNKVKVFDVSWKYHFNRGSNKRYIRLSWCAKPYNTSSRFFMGSKIARFETIKSIVRDIKLSELV
jgi:hypothetical protein